jgi:hypothetical protein
LPAHRWRGNYLELAASILAAAQQGDAASRYRRARELRQKIDAGTFEKFAI